MKVIIDFETTGLDPKDEILSVSIIDENYNVLLDERCKPVFLDSWSEAEKIHGISPEDVKDCCHFSVYIPKIEEIFNNADCIIAYNAAFEMSFLRAYGVDVYAYEWDDPMITFAEIYGEWSFFYNTYKWQSLSKCAAYYNYDFKAHNSLEDVKATLFCYKKMIEK